MTVYRFKILYEANDTFTQYRYVIAESEEQAWEKIIAYFAKMHNEGSAMPGLICDPEVELENVI